MLVPGRLGSLSYTANVLCTLNLWQNLTKTDTSNTANLICTLNLWQNLIKTDKSNTANLICTKDNCDSILQMKPLPVVFVVSHRPVHQYRPNVQV